VPSTLPVPRMTPYAQLQHDLIEVFTWPPVRQPDMQSEATPFADSPKNRAAHRSAEQAGVGKLPSTTFEHHSSADTSVALNGSVLRNDPGLARAAANVACWKTYLPQGCISAMMSDGWHWTT
jgi:hypothetical protein